MSHERLFCTFFLRELFFGIEVSKVQEIIRYQEMTKVPLASKVVKGLINLRGQIVTAIDLRHRLELGECSEEKQPMNVVMHTQDGDAVSLLVDKIGDVLDVQDSAFERPPETLEGVARDLILGAYKLPNKLLLILDVDKAVNLSA